ncbi:hypothetical protein ACIQAC_33560 [Streptomyces sp. NPDC088387]|uniref:hypothetical protein n=1 Tax=Streptomyces sp. NPDC088387 TaxID=3365859 RepID=UPI0037FECE32
MIGRAVLAVTALAAALLAPCRRGRRRTATPSSVPIPAAYEFADRTGSPFASLRALNTGFDLGATRVNESQ